MLLYYVGEVWFASSRARFDDVPIHAGYVRTTAYPYLFQDHAHQRFSTVAAPFH